LEPTAVDAQSWLHTCAQSARKAQGSISYKAHQFSVFGIIEQINGTN
jgi:hypothetical protein